MNLIEHNTQKAICQLLAYSKVFYFKVPNEGKRSNHLGKFMKSEGLMSGVSDLVILRDGGKAVFIEIKQKLVFLVKHNRNSKRMWKKWDLNTLFGEV